VTTFANNPDTIPALAQLQVHSSLRRVSLSRKHISELENLIQNTLVAIVKSRALIAQSDEVCNRFWGMSVNFPSLHDEFSQDERIQWASTYSVFPSSCLNQAERQNR
jgi:hypothetical protein